MMNKTSQSANLNAMIAISVGYVVFCLIWVNFRPEGILWTVDEGGKLVFLQNAIKQRDIFAPIEYPSQNLDPALEFVPFTYTNIKDGELRSWWLPIFPITTIPFYYLLGWLGLFVIPAVGGGLTLLATGLLAREYLGDHKRLVYLIMVVTGIATPILFYSTMFWEHSMAVAAALFSIYFCYFGQIRQKTLPFVFSGIAGAAAFALRTEMIFVLMGIGLVQLWVNWRRAVLYGLCFFFFCLPVFYINWRTIGHPLNVQLNNLTQTTDFAFLTNGLKAVPYFIFHVPKPWTYPMGKVSMVVGSLGFLAALFMPFMKKIRIILLAGFFVFLIVSWRILISDFGYKSIHGFAALAPHTALFTWFFLNWKTRKTNILNWHFLVSGLIFGIVFIYKAWIGAGGMQWGTRYLLVFYPILAIMFVVGIYDYFSEMNRWTRIFLGTAIIWAVAIGIGYQIRGLQTVLRVMQYYQESAAGLDQLKDRPVITSYCDPALIYDGRYWDQTIFSVTWQGLEAWIDHAKKMNIPSFYVIRLDICSSDPLHIVAKNRQTSQFGLDVSVYEAPDYRRVPYPMP